MCLTASFQVLCVWQLVSGYWWFQVLIISKCIHGLQACLFKYITVAAFSVYALHGEDAVKRGGWRRQIFMEITSLIMEKSWNCVFEFLFEPCCNLCTYKWFGYVENIWGKNLFEHVMNLFTVPVRLFVCFFILTLYLIGTTLHGCWLGCKELNQTSHY